MLVLYFWWCATGSLYGQTGHKSTGRDVPTFPISIIRFDDVIADENRVVIRATASGTQPGDFQGMPATNKHATWSEIHISRFEDGKIVEHWAEVDQMSMLQQLGVIPAPGQRGS